jgi:hypothetical protein
MNGKSFRARVHYVFFITGIMCLITSVIWHYGVARFFPALAADSFWRLPDCLLAALATGCIMVAGTAQILAEIWRIVVVMSRILKALFTPASPRPHR